MRIKRLRISDFARLIAMMMACAGLICGVFYAFGGVLYDAFISGGLNLGTLLAFMALVGMPVIFAMLGFLFGAIGAFLYNWFGNQFGGIELELEYFE